MVSGRDRFDKIILPYWAKRIKRLVHKPEVRDWCKLTYYNHPKGCPNYGKQKRCPPQSPYVTEVFDMDKPLYFVFSEFDLSSHVARMRRKHPHWSDRQCRCVLYWQRKSKKQMRDRAKKLMRILKATRFEPCGESIGVNLYATCLVSGLKLERIKGLSICHHIGLVGWKSLGPSGTI